MGSFMQGKQNVSLIGVDACMADKKAPMLDSSVLTSPYRGPMVRFDH